MGLLSRGKKPKVEVSDLVVRAKELVDKTRPRRKPQQDPDSYVRVVERPARPEPVKRPVLDDFGGDDE